MCRQFKHRNFIGNLFQSLTVIHSRKRAIGPPHLEGCAPQTYARHALTKNRKINIRMSDWDYNGIKLRAAQEGMPCQTLVSSIIHKYLIGKMKAS